MSHLVALLRIELDKAVKNRWFAASLAAALFIVLWSAESSVAVHGIGHQIMQDGNEWAGLTASSAYASWVVVGTGDPFRSGILFFLMPLFVVVPYSWTLRADMDDGSIAQQYVRCPRESVLVARYFAAFITSGLVVAIPLIVSLLVLLCFLPAYTPEVVSNLYIGMQPHELWAREFFTTPLLYVIYNTLLAFALCGLWGGLVLAASTIVRNRIALVVGSFLLTFAIRLINQWVFYILDLSGFTFSLTDLLYHGGSGIFPREAVPAAVVALVMAVGAFILLFSHKESDVL